MAVDARAANGTDSSADGRRLDFIFHWTDVFANEVGRSEIHETRNSYRTCTVTGPSSHRHPPTQRPTPNLWPPPDGSGWSADRAPEIPQPTGYQADSTVQLGAPHGLKFSIFSLFFLHRTMMTGPLLLFYYVTKSRKSASLLFIGCFFSSCSSMAAICGQLRTAVTHTVGHTATPPIRVEEKKKRENKCRQGRREWPTNHFQQSLGTAQTQSTKMKEKKQLVLERHVGGTRRTAPAEFAFTPAVSQFPHRRTRSGIKPLQHEICWHFLSP